MEKTPSLQSKIWMITRERLHGVVLEHRFDQDLVDQMARESQHIRSAIYEWHLRTRTCAPRAEDN